MRKYAIGFVLVLTGLFCAGAEWLEPQLGGGGTSGVADNLGNHTATQDLDMDGNSVTNVSTVVGATAARYVDADNGRLYSSSASLYTIDWENHLLRSGASVQTTLDWEQLVLDYTPWRMTQAPAITASNTYLVTSEWVKDVAQSNKWGREVIAVAASDETTALVAGTNSVTFRMPYAMTLDEVRISVTTAPVGSTLTVDINESGTTILSTKLTIDATEETSTTAATPAVISDASLADDAEITIDIDAVGASTAGAGLKVYLIDNP